jgi:D-sedoheptulose 7-phosphate isomerase
MTTEAKRLDGATVQAYFSTLASHLEHTAATLGDGAPVEVADAMASVIARAREAQATGHKLLFVGNGGSAGIASHSAIDYTKAGNLRALALNDSAALTCLSNDLGYEQVFAYQIRAHGRPGDLLIAISSSGGSPNILNAVAAARERGMAVVTLSGFAPDNPLRRSGDVNFYIGSDHYGMVEISHLAICHAMLDLHVGWERS